MEGCYFHFFKERVKIAAISFLKGDDMTDCWYKSLEPFSGSIDQIVMVGRGSVCGWRFLRCPFPKVPFFCLAWSRGPPRRSSCCLRVLVSWQQ